MIIFINSRWFALFFRTPNYWDISRDELLPWRGYLRFGGYGRKGFAFGDTKGPATVDGMPQ